MGVDASRPLVGLLNDVADVDADAELNPPVLRQAGVALDHGVLHFDGRTHGVDHAPELNNASVAGALDDAAVMRRDCGIDEVAAEAPKARERAVLVRSSEPAVADHIGDQNRRYLAPAMFRCHVGFPPVPVDK
jgi:hypothetical protein